MSPLTLSLAGLPAFLIYFIVGIALLWVFAFLYTRFTPQDELALIREGKVASSVALGGSILAFALPMCSAIIHSVSLLDFVVWGVIALIIQILTFLAVRLFIPSLPQRIASNDLAAGLFLALVSLAVGAVNAACMTP